MAIGPANKPSLKNNPYEANIMRVNIKMSPWPNLITLFIFKDCLEGIQ